MMRISTKDYVKIDEQNPRYIEDPNNTDTLTEVSKCTRIDIYHSKFFDKQVAYRYLFCLSDGNLIESAAYHHFKRDPYILQDLSIDLSTMVGCPCKCKFCASQSISYIRSLKPFEIISQFVRLVREHDIPSYPQIMCSFQGIGEASLIPEDIIEISKHLLKLDRRINISIATMGTFLRAFQIWRDSGVPIRNLQISLSGTTNEQTHWLMPASPDFKKLISEAQLCASTGRFHQIKFNYILIKDFNDSNSDVKRLISFFTNTPYILKISALKRNQFGF